LTLLVFVLGILSLTSIGIMTLSVVKQLRPTAFTAINKQLNYQGKLQNSGGITVADGNYLMKFSIYDAASGGSRLWTECGTTGTPTARTVAVANGVFSVMLGDTNSDSCPGGTDSNAINLDFNSDSYYLGLTVESDAEMEPRKRVGASGYAFNADLLDGLNTSAAGGSFAFVPVTDGSGHLTLTQNLTLGGVMKASDGAVGAPSYTFTSDLDTGLYYSATQINVGVGGAAVANVSASGLAVDTVKTLTATTLTLKGTVADGGTAVGATIGSNNTLSTAGAKLVSFVNNTTEKAYIDKDGVGYFSGGNFSGLSASSAVYTDASKNLTSTAPTSGSIGYWSRTSTTLSPATANDVVAVTGNSGDLLTLTSTATGADNKALNIAASGATTGTDYGAYISNTGAGTTNVGLYVTASGAVTNNYAAIFAAGNVGVGITSPAYTLDVSSSGTRAVNAITSNNSGYAIYGTASATGAVTNYGVYGATAGDSGRGVYGTASATGAVTNYGGYFSSAGNSGRGVYGTASATGAVTNYGGLFYAAGNTGYGVYGHATATGAVGNTGGYFRADGGSGVGVTGTAPTTGAVTNYGGYFSSAGNSGRGISAVATATGAVTNIGGAFSSAGDTGIGVQGSATGSGGVNYGVYGTTSSATGWGGYFSGGLGLYASAARINSLTASSAVYTDASKNLTSTAPTSGALGYWSRTGTVLSPTTSGDTATVAGLNVNFGPITNAYVAINPWYQNSIGSANGIGLPMNRLLGSNTGRHTVTTTGFSGGTSVLYDSFYDSAAIIPYGGTGTVEVDFNPQMGWTDNTASPSFTYENGMLVMSFYYTYFPTNITVEMYHYNSVSLVDEWTTIYTTASNNKNPLIVNTSPTITYIKKIKFTFSGGGDPGLGIRIAELEWFPTRESSANQLAVIPKYYNQNMDVSWTNLNMKKTTDWSTTATISNAGAAYFVGPVGINDTSADASLEVVNDGSGDSFLVADTNDGDTTPFVIQADGDVGIGTAAPVSLLHLVKDSTYNSENTGAIKITDSTLTDTGLIIGTDATNDIGYIQSLDPGTSYTTRPLILNPNGGYVGISDISPAALFTVGSGDLFQVNSSGAIAAATGIISSGTIQFTGLTASSAVYTDASKNLTSTAPTSGAIGYWSRSGTTLSPATANDVVSVSGTGAIAITGTSSAAGGYGIYGTATDATAVANYGGYFIAAGTGSGTAGVYGESTATGGFSPFYGGYFTAAGNLGVGVQGVATATAFATNYGVYGQADGDTGVGVRGLASGTEGINYGGYFWSNGPGGYGVYGRANSGTGTTYGVYGEVISSSGWAGYFDGGLGLYASAARIDSLSASSAVYTDASKNLTSTAPTSGAIGYWSRSGTTLSPATANDVVSVSGTGAIAITGTSSAAGGYGIYGTATDATAVANYGGYFTAAGTGTLTAGVYGEVTATADNIAGVYGKATNTGAYINYGGAFFANGENGRGVYGEAVSNAAATNYGGYFVGGGTAANTAGVYGQATNTGAVANYGGYFLAEGTGSAAAGIYGEASGAGSVYGVQGAATDTGAVANYGGYFTAAGTVTGATGVYGEASGATNLALGVHGVASATGAVTNYGGVFTGAGNTGRGVYGEATATGAYTNYGVYGMAVGDTGRAVYGTAQATTSAVNYGGYFVTHGDGTFAAGAYGEASGAGSVFGVIGYASNSGAVTNTGGAFTANGETGRGVYGQASNSAATVNYGGYFIADGAGAGTAGVRGIANGGAAVYGVYGSTISANTGASGVYGEASGAASEVIGVQGAASSSGAVANYGGYFAAFGSGTGASGVYGLATAVGIVYGVQGRASAVDNATSYGGYFTTEGYTGRGVYGYAEYIGATVNYGGYFEANGAGAGTAGVRGIANANAAVYGVYGSTSGQASGAVGVYGLASAAADVIGVQGAATSAGAYENYGGYFYAAGNSGRGVYGTAVASGAVTNYGGYFQASGNSGSAVYGLASATGAVTNYGGNFRADGDLGIAVSGWASASSATANYGGKFLAGGTGGAYGVYGEATGLSGTNYGVYGKGSVGVYGYVSATQYGYLGDSTYGVYGRGTIGVYGTDGTRYGQLGYASAGVYGTDGTRYGQLGTGSYGVYGYYDATHSGYIGGASYGIYGTGADGEGVHGEATTGYGVRGNATTGYGTSGFLSGETGRAVWGSAYNASGTTTYGGYFSSSGTSGYGVYAEATAKSTVYGVYGVASDAGAGTSYGGYFTSAGTTGRAVYGSASTTGATTAYGGYFTSASDYGRGVYGEATDTAAVQNYGGYFSAAGGAGIGVYGVASAASTVYGGYFEATNTGAVTNYGVYGKAAGDTGYGVRGEASDTGAVANYGGYFSAAGTGGGVGIYGSATGASGTNYGVYGAVTSAAGWAGYFTGGYGLYVSGSASQMTGAASGPTLTVAATSVSANNIALKVTWADSYLTTTDGGPLKIVSTTDTGFTTTGDAATRRVGLIQVDANVTSASSGNFIAFNSDVNGTPDAEFRVSMAGATYADGAYSSAGADLAEVFDVSDLSLSLGDLVVVDNVTGKLKKSSAAYEEGLVGIVTDATMAAFIGGDSDGDLGPDQRVITLIGRMSLTKVNDENGTINPGDLLTSSSMPGVAMKATKPGSVIGRALASWSGPGQGTIEVYVNQKWHSGGTITTDGTISFFNDDFTFNKTETATEIIQGYNSKGLTFRGSGWDGATAQNVEMKINNVVASASNYKLAVLNNAGQEVAYLDQAGAFGLSGKFYPASPTGAQTDAYIFYRNNRIRTNAAGWATGSFDFAEMFLSHELLEAGDVVVLDEATNEYVKKSTTTYNNMALGIVSTEPGFLAGANVDFDDPSADQGYPIALAGRVPTKVSAENGPIRPGDFLTTSATPGVAMKATESGLIIGTALESFDGPGVGLVKVFVNLSWYNVMGETTPVGELAQLTLTGDLNMNGNYILNVGKIVGLDEKWSIDENGILKVKLIAEDAGEKEMFGVTSDKVELTLSGSSRLENGTKMIDLSLLDPEFIKHISAETALKIIVTLTEPANGVYVAEKTAYSFRVAELNAGTSDAAFDWIVIARRKGYEDPPTTPAPSEPAPSAPSEPPPSEPAPETPPSEPAPSEPVPTEPTPEVPPVESAPSEPAPSEPAPSEPAPAP